MPRILLDHNVPAPLARLLTGHDVARTSDRGWEELSNGDLLAIAEANGFEIMITADKNIRYQQNLAGRLIAIIELTTGRWDTVRVHVTEILAALESATLGSYATVTLPRPPLRRRPFKWDQAP